jgi:hypothetical protein
MPKVEEGNISEETGRHYELLAHKVIENLAKNNIEAEYAINRQEALAMVIEAIPPEATIGIGDSVTLHQIGLFDWLKQGQHQVFNPFLRAEDGDPLHQEKKIFDLMRKAMLSDVFLASANAVTLDGKLVNVDGRGNRAAAILFGPKKTILIVGVNKIVKDVNQALMRIKLVAAPINNTRHLIKHGDHFLEMGIDLKNLPCLVTGSCISNEPWENCKNPSRSCHKITIIDGQVKEVVTPEEAGISVILVGENLGY